MRIPESPHAVISLQKPGSDEAEVAFDSWEHKQLFQSISIDLVTNESSQAEIAFYDPKFRIIDSFSGTDGVPLAEVKVYIGYGKELGEPAFKGLLAHVERGESSTSLIAYDMGFKMKLLKRAGYKNRKNDLKVIKELAKRNGLKFEGPKKAKKLEAAEAIMQDEQSDWEWALERARESGLVVFVREDTLFAKYPAQVEEPITSFINRKDFVLQRDWDFRFRTPESQEGRPKQVKRRGRGKGGRRVEGKTRAGKRGRENVVLKRDQPGRSSKKKLTKRAKAQKELEREHAFEANVTGVIPWTLDRLPDVRKTVRVEDVGLLFSGDYIIDSVGYRFEPGTMEMSLDLYRDVKE